MASSGNKARTQKLVKEHMKTLVSQFRGSIIYCESETSTNLNTDMTSTDFGFKHLEADTMMLFAYAKLMADNNKEVVVSGSNGTDVYVQAAYVSLQFQGDQLMKR